MPGMMPFGLKIAIINRAFRKRMDEKAADMGLTSAAPSAGVYQPIGGLW